MMRFDSLGKPRDLLVLSVYQIFHLHVDINAVIYSVQKWFLVFCHQGEVIELVEFIQ